MTSFPPWWPTNPYSATVFPMTDEEYSAAVPDDDTRTAISGRCARLGWESAEVWILDAIRRLEPEELAEWHRKARERSP